MTHTAQVRASLTAIPAHKWRTKITRFVFALLLGALFYFVALPQKWSVWIELAIAVAIGFCISADLMGAIVKFLIAAVRDLAAALPGRTGGNPPPSVPPAPPAPPRVTP